MFRYPFARCSPPRLRAFRSNSSDVHPVVRASRRVAPALSVASFANCARRSGSARSGTRRRSVVRVEFDTRDECRRDVATRGLTPDAVAHLTRDALGRIELENLAPVKRLLKQFFSDALWTARDDDALAALVGPGRGWWEHDLGGGCKFAFGWRGGTFRLGLE